MLLCAVGGEDLGDAVAGRADARQVRRSLMAERGDVAHRGERLVAGRAAGAVGDAEELGPHAASSCTTVFSFSLPTGVLGGKNSKLTGTASAVSCRDSRWPRDGVEEELARAFAAGVALSNQSSTSRPMRRAALRRRFSAWP